MTRRVAAAQGLVDAWRGRAFAWGSADCARLAAALLRAMGHRAPLSKFGRYSSPIGAAKALQARGFKDLAQVVDSLGFLRIPQASALPGDLVGFRHETQPLQVGLAVCLGAGRVLGFMDNGDGERCHVFPPVMTAEGADYLAWRVEPR